MSEPKVVVHLKETPAKHIQVKACIGDVIAFAYLDHRTVDATRRALNERHKARKAAKKAERRFYVDQTNDPDVWVVRDRDHGDAEATIIASFWCGSGDAKAFARMLNKANRKPMGGEA